MYNNAGPMWLGRLWDEKLVEKMIKENNKSNVVEDVKFLETINSESKIAVVGFHDIHALVKRYKLKHVPKTCENVD